MIKVVGIGNRLMMDDGIALEVLDNIRNHLETMGAEVLIGETDFQFLFHQLKQDDYTVVLDATSTGSDAGSIFIIELQQALAIYDRNNFQHDMNIFDLMKLYSKPLKGYLILIEIGETGIGCELSEVLSNKFHGICIEVEKIIRNIINQHRNLLSQN